VRNVLVANPAEMRPLGRFCHRGKANIKMDFKKQTAMLWNGFTWEQYCGPLAGFCTP